MKITIPSYKSYQYKEVWKITEWKDGYIYKTEKTGKYIKTKRYLNPHKYILASLSTDLTNQETIELDVEPFEYFT